MLAPTEYRLHFTEDPSDFLDRAAQHLAKDPVLSTVVSTVTHRALGHVQEGMPAPEHPRWWVTASDASGQVVGAAMRTAPFSPHPLFVLPMPEDAARALAAALVERGEDVRGVNGALPAAQVLADELSCRIGGTATLGEQTRLWVLGDLVESEPPAGRLRAATDDDLELCLSWFEGFDAAAAEQAGREPRTETAERFQREDVASRIGDRRVWLWEDTSGEVVHLTAFNPPSFGVARIGPVYTPREHRGRGYAGAAVAAVSRLLLNQGARVCLFTDQANPTSNKVYARVGFVPVVDMVNLVVTTPGPA